MANRLEEARAEAERASRAKSRFLAAASHDLIDAESLGALVLHKPVPPMTLCPHSNT